MERNEEIDLTKRKMTSQLIVERALARGWDVTGFETARAIFLLRIPGRDKPIKIFSSAPPQTSYAVSKITKDKAVTNALLGEIGLPVPAEMAVSIENYDLDVLNEFLTKYKKVVVKPLDASHGKGITVGITTTEQLQKAIEIAKPISDRSKVIMQQHVEGIDVRIVCIDYKFVDSISRQPATVVGDGAQTVRQLIETTNNGPDRGLNYTKRLNIIPIDKVEAYLGVEALDRVPAAAEAVQVIGVSNVGMGGERHNLKYEVPEFLKNMAIEAAKVLDLPVCGIDFMVQRLPQATDTQADLMPAIIEANECPMLTMYDDLHSPEQSAVIDGYLDYIATS